MISLVIADDQPVVRAGLVTLLAVEPDIVILGEADNGRAAIDLVNATDPDVVLMDIRMPVLDGIAATADLVASGSRCRVCILTTYGVDEYVHDALIAGASGFLLKTDSPARIASTVRAVAAGEFALGTATSRHLAERFTSRPLPDSDSLARMATLTEREREVFDLIADGLTNAEIAGRLFVGEGTVKTHVARVLAKLDLRDRVQVAVFAHRSGLAR
ncbi:MAG: response regulator transcription factor [Candidatus Nanopelagicales bacterium]